MPSTPQDWALKAYASGSTEPWTADLVVALAKSIQAKHILETGGFIGMTSVLLARATPYNGSLTIVEIDPDRCQQIAGRLVEEGIDLGEQQVRLMQVNVLDMLRACPQGPTWDFAFVDDDHSYHHVAAELELLMPLMKPGGLVAVHDVEGPFGLSGLIHDRGGFIVPCTHFHAAGSLGLIRKF